MSEVPVVDVVPSSASVMAELVLLRQREGMTAKKILQHGYNLQHLPVTKHELKRLGLGPSDLHVAAFQAIECAIQSLVKRTDEARILAKTLNLDSAQNNLEKRRSQLKTELHLTTKEYRKVEDDAFFAFAAVLVSCRRSPCKLVNELSPITFEFQMTVNPKDLQMMLHHLSLEDRFAVREAISRAVLTSLHNATQVLGETTKNIDVGHSYPLFRLIDMTLARYWPQENGRKLGLLNVASMRSMFNPPPIAVDSILRDIAQKEDMMDVAVEPSQTYITAGSLTEGFHQTRHRSLQVLASRMVLLEQEDRWRDVVPRAAPQPSPSTDRTQHP